MIERISIKNFRCFKSLELKNCRRINVVVGDNGSGKTALLEAIFIALGSSPEIAMRMRQWRGLDSAFAGTATQLEDAIWGDLFYGLNLRSPIEIKLTGLGPETRSVKISRGKSRVFVPATQRRGFRPVAAHSFSSSSEIGLTFEWHDADGLTHTYSPKITSKGIEIPGTEEDLPNYFFFASSVPTSSMDTATRFSILSRANQQEQFVELFKQQYDQIQDLSLEVVGGAPALYATVKGVKEKIPVTSVSGAINRLLGILLTIVSRPQSVVIIDEADNGIYFKRHAAFWKTILTFARTFDSQLFLSTHNEEWLAALAQVAGDETDDIALWRVIRGDDGPIVHQFAGTAFKAAEEYGGEIR
jgi:Fe-S cluster assembly ATPase SufC